MSGLIDSIECAQLRRVPVFQAGDRVRGISRSWRGSAAPYPGLRGCGDQAPGSGARETFTVASSRSAGGGADVPPALAEDRADRGGLPRRCAGRSCTTCVTVWAAPARARAALDGRDRDHRAGRHAARRRTAPGRGGAGRAGRGGGGRGGRGGGCGGMRPPAGAAVAAPSRTLPPKRRVTRVVRPTPPVPPTTPPATPLPRTPIRRPPPRTAARLSPTTTSRRAPARKPGTAEGGAQQGEEHPRIADRAGHDRRGRSRPRPRDPGLSRQALPHPERADGAHPRNRPARAGGPSELPLRRSGAGRRRRIQATRGSGHEYLRRAAPSDTACPEPTPERSDTNFIKRGRGTPPGTGSR